MIHSQVILNTIKNGASASQFGIRIKVYATYQLPSAALLPQGMG